MAHSVDSPSASQGYFAGKHFSPGEIRAYPPFGPIPESQKEGALERAKSRMQIAGVWSGNQILGRQYPIGCVALEITQRCNLDCTLCYLSESSESTRDIPLEAIYSRIDDILAHYGARTDVQITGGDPTLRKRSELLGIIRRVRERGMRPTFMTNGILCTRDLMIEMHEAGLNDVAFHVDITQERKGFATEVQMNSIRQEYIERARGLPLMIIFNTTVCRENFDEIPDLVRFFRDNASVVGMASFQLQAETGRGTWRGRDEAVITIESVKQQIERGAETRISFGKVRIGHRDCNTYGLTMVAGGKVHDFLDSDALVETALAKAGDLVVDRAHPIRSALKVLGWAARHPSVVWVGLPFMARHLWRMKWDLLRSRFHVRKLSFFIHDFMDASRLQCDRINACSFMVITPQGPISMCMHNAKRDDYILQPLQLESAPGKVWDPMSGTLRDQP